MKISIFTFSRQGIITAGKIVESLGENEISSFCPERIRVPGFNKIPEDSFEFYKENFVSSSALIFVGSCGIAVRLTAPHIKSKTTDPAVITVDELGKFVIPLLSGHIGGANSLALELSEKLGAIPVITTATDIEGRFSPDSWAAARGWAISDMKAAKMVSAAILEGDVGLISEFPIKGQLPPGLELKNSGDIGIYLGFKTLEPFKTTLRLIPRCLNLGIGCRRATEADTISQAFRQFMAENSIDERAVKAAASIDIKRDEPGLIEFCENKKLPLSFYTAEELMKAQGEFSHSEFVLKTTGADNVCERAAVNCGGKLIVKKTSLKGVTLALSCQNTEVNFGKA